MGSTPVLRELALGVGAGERVALVGPSGAGKTSLLRLFNASRVPDRGRVLVEGAQLDQLDERGLARARARVGFVHQDLALVPILRVVHNVLAGGLGRAGLFGALRSQLWPARDELCRVHALLERLGIAELMYRRTDSLSGGEQQRVAIARALYQQPVALLADEPVASVDPARAQRSIELFCDLAEEHGLALLVSLHDLELARAHFERIIGLRAGRVVFDEPAQELDDARFHELFSLGASDD